MKNKYFLATLFLGVMLFSACSSSSSSTSNSSGDSSGKFSLSSVPKPDGTDFEFVSFQNIGKLKMPVGEDWDVSVNQYDNAKLDMTLLTRNTPGNFMAKIKEFTDDYVEGHKTDASGYKLTKIEQTEIDGIPVVRIDGEFDNGTVYVAREYLFFVPKEVAVLVSSVDKKNADTLAPIVDYMAGSFLALPDSALQ